jgi:hypothetical protein
MELPIFSGGWFFSNWAWELGYHMLGTWNPSTNHITPTGSTLPLQGVCHTVSGLAIYIFKKYLKAKRRRIMAKLKYYFTMQKYNLQKNLLKKNPKSFKILLLL